MSLQNPNALLLLLLLPVFLAAWRYRRATHAAVLALRLLIVALLILVLANPLLGGLHVSEGLLVVLVDQSDSLGADGKLRLREQALRLVREHQSTTRVIFFAAKTAPSGPLQAGALAPPEALQADSTNLAQALRLARELIGRGAGAGSIMLLSDGRQTHGDALQEADMLAQRSIAVHTLAFQDASRSEVWVESVEAPRTLREGEAYEVTISVGSRQEASARLSLTAGSQQLEVQDVRLTPGQNRFTYRGRAGAPGIVGLRATIAGPPDTIEQNNSAATTATVAPRPQVLLVEGEEGAARALRAALRPAGIDAEVIGSRLLLSQLSALKAYDGIVLVNVPADALSLDQLAALREFVRSEGRGLLVTGGRASFTLGSYKGTPLEEVLPLAMTPPSRPERPPVTLLLIIDQSASMYGTAGQSKLDMAKEAALLATETLAEEDRFGVLTFDTAPRWAVELQLLSGGLSVAEIQDRISRISIGGGTNIYTALESGLRSLAEQPGDLRHVVLLTDGKSTMSDPSRYSQLLEEARAHNITLSTIAIGDDSDTELLQDLARQGAGRYHFAAEPQDIPRLTLQESEIARSEPQVEGEFQAELAMPHPVLRGFAPAELPRLGGYAAATTKPEAELVLRSPKDDPLLAVWQYGLGRAVAWTPSIAAPWAEAWVSWPQYGDFWAQVIRYTLPEPDSGPLQVRVLPRDDAVAISADAVAASGEPFDLADTRATITLPDGGTSSLQLRQTAPGHYEREVRLPLNGPYAVEVHQRKDGEERVARAGYAQRYSAEYLPSAAGEDLLRQISAMTGGESLTPDAGPLSPLGASSRTPRSLWPWLLLAAALLWPLEIALRRGWLPRRLER